MNARAAAACVRGELAATGIPDAAFEAEFLVREAAGLTRSAYFAGTDIGDTALDSLARLVERRQSREPAAYLAGRREFFGLEIEVAPGVLIPRPETELLVEIALTEIAELPAGATVVDVATGSGCIAAAIARESPTARVVATEIQPDALTLARRNLARLAPGIQLVRGDLASAISRADVVVANLPYIPSPLIETLEPEVRDWEPRTALDGGPDGLDLVRRLVDDCAQRLRPRLLALEVMAGQAQTVAAYAHIAGAHTAIRRDLAGIERAVVARWE